MEYFRQRVFAWQQECEGSWQVAFHQFEYGSRDVGKVADGANVVAYYAQGVLLWRDVPDAANALHSPFLQGVAGEGVGRVRRDNHHFAVLQSSDQAVELSRIIVGFV